MQELKNGFQGTLKEVRDALGMDSAGFAREWKRLSEMDREQLKQAVWSGTLTY